MRRNLMYMQLFGDIVAIVINIGVWVALGLLIRWFILKLKR
jgi:hypothetical protein